MSKIEKDPPSTLELLKPEATHTPAQRAAPFREVIEAVRAQFHAVDGRAHERANLDKKFAPNRFGMALEDEPGKKMAHELYRKLVELNIVDKAKAVMITPKNFSEQTGLGREVTGLQFLNEHAERLLPDTQITLESLAPSNGHSRNVVSYAPVNTGTTVCVVVGDDLHFWIDAVDEFDLPGAKGEPVDHPLHFPLTGRGSEFMLMGKTHLGTVVPVIDEERFNAYVASTKKDPKTGLYALLPEVHGANRLLGKPTSMLCLTSIEGGDGVIDKDCA